MYFVECVSTIEHILLVIHYSVYGAVCVQLAHFFRFDYDNKTKQYILSTITRELGKLKTYSPIYWIMDN